MTENMQAFNAVYLQDMYQGFRILVFVPLGPELTTSSVNVSFKFKTFLFEI